MPQLVIRMGVTCLTKRSPRILLDYIYKRDDYGNKSPPPMDIMGMMPTMVIM